MALPPRRPDGNNPQPKPGAKAVSSAKPAPAASARKVDIPGEEGSAAPVKRPPTGEQKAVQGEQRPMAPRAGGPDSRDMSGKRSTSSMVSMDPPRRGPKLAPGARMDGIAARMAAKGPTLSQTRLIKGKDDKANLFGRRKTEELNKDIANRAPLERADAGAGGAYDAAQHMARKKHTVRVPKPGGGVMSADSATLDRMNESGRRPAVPSPGAAMPPVSTFARAQESAPKRPDVPPPPPSFRSNTLAGVSAEELLGEEGKALMDSVKRREADRRPGVDYDTRKVKQAGGFAESVSPVANAPQSRAPISPIPVSQHPVSPLPPRPVQPQYAPPVSPLPARQATELPPRAQDSSRMAFAEAGGDASPSDDLGYEKPVDFGGDSAAVVTDPSEVVYEEDELSEGDLADGEQAARESQAHEEMEQLVGYMLWLQGVITVEEVEEAIQSADPTEAREDVMALLNNSGFTGQESLYRFLARHESVAPVDLTVTVPTEAALGTLRPAVARAYRVVPLAVLGKILLVAASMPFEPQRLLELRSLTGRKIKVFVTSADEIDAALKKFYPGGPRAGSGRQAAVADRPATGEVPKPAAPGGTLEQGYDPTVSGEDSGLYVSVDGTPKARVPDDVALESAEDAAQGQTTPVTTSTDFSPTDSTQVARDRSEAADSGDLDESSLGGGPDPLGDDNELKLGEESPAADRKKQGEKPIVSGPEDLDPFGD